ncbi:hypothetical protein AUP74_02364 [Microbulbifer aggregans]|uniref:Sulfotransferase family protein n=1 Tax=Microbulbifer aggregans TaxID=1769779 RepID=A0A1C9W9D5_9GAMM|nr:hypothetical protein [Microbulbifer aggregans]AOS97767.1 hypothetical protein AUP74_02364 [Microbulbifer aggregans]
MKAIVHIGTEKTGTSTIQEFFNLNRARLMKIGVAYLKSPGPINNRKLATYCMRDDFIDDHIKQLGLLDHERRQEWKREFLAEFQGEIQGLGSGAQSVVISSEHFHSRLRGRDEVQNLKEILEPYFDDIQIVVYLRRQDELAVSHYSTHLKTGKFRDEVLDSRVSADNSYFDYYGLAKKWSEVFGFENVTLRPFVKERLERGDVLEDFLSQCDIDSRIGFKFPERKNETLSAPLQKFLRAFNQAFPRYQDNREDLLSRDLRNFLIQGLSGSGITGGEKVLPSRAQALEFYQRFSDGNNRLFDEFFNGESIFSGDFSRYPIEPQVGSLPEDFLAQALKLVASYINLKLINEVDVKTVKRSAGPGLMLRDVGLMFKDSQPEVALCLLREASKYRPNGPKILAAIEELEERIGQSS